MRVIEEIPGAFLFPLLHLRDRRGMFVKLNTRNLYENSGINFDVQDEFITFSKKNTLRGMHFQAPPFSHDKLVYCLHGRAIDVLLDLRPGINYGNTFQIDLFGCEPEGLFVPAGVAHGFLAIEDNTVMLYNTNSKHSPVCDLGVLWSSINFDWKCDNPILSERDLAHPHLKDFASPF